MEVVDSQADCENPPAGLIARAVALTIARERAGAEWRVTVLLATEERMRQLNRDHGGEDAATDVLSFNHTEGWRQGALPRADAAPPGLDEGYLGDIALCIAIARRQAADVGRTLEQELALLTVHGTLHLLGYDHAEEGEKRAMFARTDAILDELLRTGGAA